MKKINKILWKPINSEEIFKTRIFTVCDKESLSPEQESHHFVSLQAPDWAVVVPVLKKEGEEDCFIMVEQWRHGTESVFIEFPGGVIDQGEKAEEAARRELLEETGRNASSLKLLSVLSPNPAMMENHCYIFLAEIDESVQAQNLDNDEFMNVKEIPVKTVLENMGKADYAHAIMNAAAFLYLQEKSSK